MIEHLIAPFHYSFMQRAFLTAILVGVLCATMGTYVILRKLAFIGDGIAHASFAGIVIAYLRGTNFYLGAGIVAVITALGIGFLLSALNVRYRDVPYAIPVFLQVLPLLSGVPYAVNEIPQKWQWILSVNPMTTVVSGWRWAILSGPAPDPAKAAIGIAVAIGLLVAGLAFFRRSEPRFADTI